jgi:hypothetical protein
MSVGALAKFFDVSRRTIENWRREEEWDALRQKIDDQRLEKSMAQIVERATQNDKNHLGMWAFVDSQIHLRMRAQVDGRFAEAEKHGEFMPLDDLERIAKVMAVSWATQGMILGTHGKNGKITEQEAGQKRVLVEYDPFSQTLEFGADEDEMRDADVVSVAHSSAPPAPITAAPDPVRPRERRRR